MNSAKVYIIIVNYGTPKDTIECLESIVENSYSNFQTMIVDVQDKNNSLNIISNWINKRNDNRFSIIKISNNKGFAFANNVGISYAAKQNDAEFIWLLNNDTVILKDTLQHLINCHVEIVKTTKIGFLGSKTVDYQNRKIIQNIGGTFNKWTGYSILIGMGEEDHGQYNNANYKTDYIIGASMFFQMSLIAIIGMMPEEYFLYYEDIDWCFAAKKAGLENKTCTKSIVYHKQGATTGAKLKNDNQYINNKKYLYSSYLLFYKKYFKKFLLVAYFILIKQWAGRMFHGNYIEAKIIFNVLINK